MQGSDLRAQLLRGGAGSLGLKIANICLGLGMAVVLARTLGVNNYGIYTYVFALVSFLAVPAKFGLPNLVVRETARAEVNQQWGLMWGIWRWAGFVAVALSLSLAVLGGLFAWFFSDYFTRLQLTTFGWGLLFVPLLTLGMLRGAALRGLRKVVRGQLPEQLIRPALLIVFVLLFGIFSQSEMDASQAMALNVLAMAIGFAVGVWLLHREKPAELSQKPIPEYRTRQWAAGVLPFALIGGMQLINTQIDIIMLGIFGSAHDVGLYRIAVRGAALVLLALVAIRQVTAPYFARFHANQEMQKLQRLATTVSRIALLSALPATVVFIAFGADIIRIVFGAEYTAAYFALAILAFGRLLGAGFGPIGSLLNMSGNERDTMKVMAVSAVCNVVLNAVLIPLYGINGAAIATSSTFFARRLVMWWLVRLRLGVDGSALWLPLRNTSSEKIAPTSTNSAKPETSATKNMEPGNVK